MEQNFYFNDKGKIVVITKEGRYVNGESEGIPYEGKFECDAKTLKVVENLVKGIPVMALSDKRYGYIFYPSGFEKIVEELNEEIKELQETKNGYNILFKGLNDAVKTYINSKWYKRKEAWKQLLSKLNKYVSW